ncbi:MAG TPA: flagellar hook-associated protein FlgK [Bryobacteraceae bacterium]|nr:flagellar hook-associated protein FlgK [Bryobacteraceae bacterium]HOL71247.1 flagellar hook-associated protein FlgK [Bryobacteraceae bacterium]HPQ17320.1 flagellar hook-associated protein FlgK [Bryobacteraceae bacterium]
MSGLFGALRASANSLHILEYSLATVQNNVLNASTPGYAKQRLLPLPAPFVPEQGLPGGIVPGQVQSLRSEYAERSVRQETHLWAHFDQFSKDLAKIERLFDISGQSGIPGALNKLFQSFSAWSLAPNDLVPRREVIDRATEAAAQFAETAASLNTTSTVLDQQIREAVETINNLASSIRDLNVQMQRDHHARSDPSLDARLHATLENLAEYTDFTALFQPDGTVTILMGGQVPLVIGVRQYRIEPEFAGSETRILDSDGKDVTAQAATGRLGAMLELKNTVLPSYMSELNRLAASLADDVNAMLAAGLDTNGNPGAPLFAYDSADEAASTLRVTNITPDQLAAAAPDAPLGNANALALAGLATAPRLDGLSYTAYYGRLAATIGQVLHGSRSNRDTHEQLLLQSRSIRDEISAVSLDEEAARLIELQRAYEATARVIVILNELTQTTIDMMR